MKKRIISFLLVAMIVFSLVPTALAASDEANEAANKLYELGLFKGTGTDANGNPVFDLDRAPTRHEAVTMLVRLLGKGEEAEAGNWEPPFTDVVDWAKPYVGYAYANGLTAGTSATTYSGDDTVTASQYLTFVLRALGYDSSTDFQWDKAWELSDKIGLTDGRYNEQTTEFLRGDVAIISNSALYLNKKNSENSIYKDIISEKAILYRVRGESYSVWDSQPIPTETNTQERLELGGIPDTETLTWKSSDTSIATVENGLVTLKGKAGTVIITVTTSSGITREQKIEVSLSADDFYDTFHAAFTQQPTSTHVYSLLYNGRLSREDFVEEFNFGSKQWEECAERYAKEIVSKDKYASVIGFYLPDTGYKRVFLGNVTHSDYGYSQWWQSKDKIADENY